MNKRSVVTRVISAAVFIILTTASARPNAASFSFDRPDNSADVSTLAPPSRLEDLLRVLRKDGEGHDSGGDSATGAGDSSPSHGADAVAKEDSEDVWKALKWRSFTKEFLLCRRFIPGERSLIAGCGGHHEFAAAEALMESQVMSIDRDPIAIKTGEKFYREMERKMPETGRPGGKAQWQEADLNELDEWMSRNDIKSHSFRHITLTGVGHLENPVIARLLGQSAGFDWDAVCRDFLELLVPEGGTMLLTADEACQLSRRLHQRRVPFVCVPVGQYFTYSTLESYLIVLGRDPWPHLTAYAKKMYGEFLLDEWTKSSQPSACAQMMMRRMLPDAAWPVIPEMILERMTGLCEHGADLPAGLRQKLSAVLAGRSAEPSDLVAVAVRHVEDFKKLLRKDQSPSEVELYALAKKLQDSKTRARSEQWKIFYDALTKGISFYLANPRADTVCEVALIEGDAHPGRLFVDFRPLRQEHAGDIQISVVKKRPGFDEWITRYGKAGRIREGILGREIALKRFPVRVLFRGPPDGLSHRGLLQSAVDELEAEIKKYIQDELFGRFDPPLEGAGASNLNISVALFVEHAVENALDAVTMRADGLFRKHPREQISYEGRVCVELSVRERGVEIRVVDNGLGAALDGRKLFDQEVVEFLHFAHPPKLFPNYPNLPLLGGEAKGVRTMNQFSQECAGALSVAENPGGGLVLSLILPFHRAGNQTHTLSMPVMDTLERLFEDWLEAHPRASHQDAAWAIWNIVGEQGLDPAQYYPQIYLRCLLEPMMDPLDNVLNPLLAQRYARIGARHAVEDILEGKCANPVDAVQKHRANLRDVLMAFHPSGEALAAGMEPGQRPVVFGGRTWNDTADVMERFYMAL